MCERKAGSKGPIWTQKRGVPRRSKSVSDVAGGKILNPNDLTQRITREGTASTRFFYRWAMTEPRKQIARDRMTGGVRWPVTGKRRRWRGGEYRQPFGGKEGTVRGRKTKRNDSLAR